MADELQTWDLWYPDAAATGLPFARCRIEPAAVLWVHAAPPRLAVTVREGSRVVARSEPEHPLERIGPRTPMTRLAVTDGMVTREDRWPVAEDLGAAVVLPGGEAGSLRSWWNAPDGSEWRWSVEFYNRA